MRTIRFRIGAGTLPDLVRVTRALDPDGPFITPVDINPATLVTTEGWTYWPVDIGEEYWLRLSTVRLEPADERFAPVPIPPIADVDICTVTVLVQSQSGVPVAGVELVSSLKNVPAKVGAAIIDPTQQTAITNSAGLAAFQIRQGVKAVITSRVFSSLRLPVDTTGKATIDLAAQVQ